MIELRRAGRDDAYPLWLWANDEATRAVSGDRPLIAWPDHLDWYRDRLASPNALILIAESLDRRPVGAIRFESTDAWTVARLSYVVAPESRGQGIGWELLTRGTAHLLREAAAVTIEAVVRASNTPSIRLFQRLGWRSERRPDGQWLFRGPNREAV